MSAPTSDIETLTRQWWFVTSPQGFDDFADDRLAQGYEAIARHPGFLDWARSDCAMVPGRGPRPPIWPLEVVQTLRVPPSWIELTQQQKNLFVWAFRDDLDAIGCVPVILAHDRFLTVDCRASDEAIAAGLKALLRNRAIMPSRLAQAFRNRPVSGLYRDEREFRTPTIPGQQLKFRSNPSAPGWIDIDLEPLLRVLEERSHRDKFWTASSLAAPIKCFLKENRAYQQYRSRYLADRATITAALHEHFPTWAKDTLPGYRRRIPEPENLVLSFMANDWQAAGHKMPGLYPAMKGVIADVLDIHQCPSWRHRLDALYALHRKVKLHLPRRITLPKRKAPPAMSRQEMALLGFD